MKAQATISLNAQPFVQGANLVTQSTRKIDASLTSSAKSTLGMKNAYTQVDTAIKKNSTSLSALGNQYKQVEQSQAKMGKGLSLAQGNMLQMGKDAEVTGSKLSKLGGFMKNNLTNASLLAGGIAGLDDQFHRLTKAQVGAERASFMKEKVDQRILKLEEALRKMREKGLQNTNDYALKEKDLALAREQAGIAAERAEVAQTTLSEATEDFYIGILPNLIFVGGSAMSMVKDLGINFDSLKGKLGGVSGAMGKFNGLLGMGLGAGLGATFAITLITQVEDMQKKWKEAGIEWQEMGSIFTDSLDEIIKKTNTAAEEFDEFQKRSPKSVGEMALFGDPKKMKQDFQEAGGMINKHGKLIKTLSDDTFDLGIKTEATTRQYIDWTRNKILQNKTHEETIKWLTEESKLAPEVAERVYAEALKDANQARKEKATIIPQIVEAEKKATEATRSSIIEEIIARNERNRINNQHIEMAGLNETTAEMITRYKNAVIDSQKPQQDDAANKQKMIDGFAKLREEAEYAVPGYLVKYQKAIQALPDAIDPVAENFKKLTTDTEGNSKSLEENYKLLKEGKLHYTTMANGFAHVQKFGAEAGQTIDEDTKTLDAFHKKMKEPVVEGYAQQYARLEEQRQKQIQSNAKTNSLLLAENASLVEQARSLGVSEDKLQDYIAGAEDGAGAIENMNDHLRDQSVHWAQQANDLMLGADRWKHYNDAVLSGTTSAGEFIKQLVFGRSETEAWTYEMDRHIPGVTKLVEQYGLTREQVEGLITDWEKGENAIANFNKEFIDFSNEWEKADMAKGFFKIEADPEEQMKNLMKDLPKKLRGKVKADLKIEQEGQDLKLALKGLQQAFMNAAKGQVWNFDPDIIFNKKGKLKPQGAIDYAKSIVENIEDVFGKGGKEGGPAMERVVSGLKDAIDKGGKEGMDMVRAIMNGEDWKELMSVDPIPVYLVADPNTDLSAQVQKLQDENGEPIDIQGKLTEIIPNEDPLFKGGGLDMGEGGPTVDVTGNVNGVDIDPAFADDPSQTGLNFKGNIESVQFFSGGPKGLNPAEGAAASTAIHGVIKSALDSVDWNDLKTRLMNNLFNADTFNQNLNGQKGFEMDEKDWEAEGMGEGSSKPKTPSNPFEALAMQASKAMTGLKNNLKVGMVAASDLQEYIGNLSNYGARSFVALAKSSSKNMNGLDSNLMEGNKAASDLQEYLGNLSNYGARSLVALAKSSSKNMNGFVNNLEKGEEAVNSLQEAIDSLEDKTVTVTVHKRSTGGFATSEAKGDVISAASGKITTTVGPTMFLYGDNPGGRETLAFIPHNNPYPTLEKLGAMFGTLGNDISNGIQTNKGGGSNIHIHNHFLQREVQQVLNVEKGRMISRMG